MTKFRRFEITCRNFAKAEYFSVLFTQSDTFYIKKYSSSNIDTLYFSDLPNYSRTEIDRFVRTINHTPLDSMMDFKSMSDAFFYYLDYGNEEHTIHLQSEKPPKAFSRFNNWINRIRDSLHFTMINNDIKFKEDSAIHETLRENSR